MGTNWRTVASYMAGCEECDWTGFMRNAHGLAAQHARRHNHTVRVEKSIAYYINDKRPNAPGADKAGYE